MKVIITFGTFDLLHIGHINILKRAKELGDKLIVGVSSDKFTFEKKNKYPIYNENDRMNIIKSIKYVNDVFFENSFEQKKESILKYNASILVMGDDWEGKFDEYKQYCDVIYLPRTENISTTEIIYNIKN